MDWWGNLWNHTECLLQSGLIFEDWRPLWWTQVIAERCGSPGMHEAKEKLWGDRKSKSSRGGKSHAVLAHNNKVQFISTTKAES